MLITKTFIKDMLKNSYPNLKIKEFQDSYFDDKSYTLDDRYCYFGVLNINTTIEIINLKNQSVLLSGVTNPVVFKNIIGGNYTFIGFKIEADLI